MIIDGVGYKERIARRNPSFVFHSVERAEGFSKYNQVHIYSDLIKTNDFVRNDSAICGIAYREIKT